MEIIEPSSRIVDELDTETIMTKIEKCGRNCYNSFDKITKGSAEKFISGLVKKGHESVIEHQSITVELVTDRAVLAEITRHRLTSFSVRSQRYCKYDDGVQFVRPTRFKKDTILYNVWRTYCKLSECGYKVLRRLGAKPEDARTVLNNSTATVIYCTANLREWRWIFKQRTSPAAHPDIRALMLPLYEEMAKALPAVFMDMWDEVHGC